MEKCPTCGREFETERGLKIHHSKAHNESISGVELTCAHCGDTYRKPPSEAERSRFCSRDCLAAHRSEELSEPFGGESNRVELTCEWCGTSYSRAASNAEGSRFCSKECQSAAQSVEFSSEDWHLQGVRGADHPSYEGSDEYRGTNWPEQREAALERDDRQCVNCGLSMEEHIERHGCELHVHHIDPIGNYDVVEDANTLDNLLTVCRSCHSKVEGLSVSPETFHTEGKSLEDFAES